MNKTIILIMLVSSFSCPAWAQSGVSPYYRVPDSLSGSIVMIPAGTTFEGRISNTIGSSVSRQGERFTISISSPVLANGSDVLIPVGAEVMGEVVQAVPAHEVPVQKVPHHKKQKPPGQLRVQITALKMPDGMTYPMVASLVGEEAVSLNSNGGYGGSMPKNPTLGSGIGYVGTQSGFHSVAPGPRMRNNYGGNGSSSPVVTKSELLSDPILGRDHDMDNAGPAAIRSLVKKNRELYIYAGSPLTVRLDAPFKMGMSASAGAASSFNVKPLQSEESSIPTQAPPATDPIPFGSPPSRPSQPVVQPYQPGTGSYSVPPSGPPSSGVNPPPPFYQPPAVRSNPSTPPNVPSRSSQDSNF